MTNLYRHTQKYDNFLFMDDDNNQSFPSQLHDDFSIGNFPQNWRQQDKSEKQSKSESSKASKKKLERKSKSKRTKTKRNKRVNNTIFKTSLSQFRKTLLDIMKRHKEISWIKEEVKKVCKRRNFSVFPKLSIITAKLNIQTEVRLQWIQRSRLLLSKKQSKLQQNAFDGMRLLELQKTITKMSLALEAKSTQQMIDSYWGEYRQNTKHQESIKEVLDFEKDFEVKAE